MGHMGRIVMIMIHSYTPKKDTEGYQKCITEGLIPWALNFSSKAKVVIRRKNNPIEAWQNSQPEHVGGSTCWRSCFYRADMADILKL